MRTLIFLVFLFSLPFLQAFASSAAASPVMPETRLDGWMGTPVDAFQRHQQATRNGTLRKGAVESTDMTHAAVKGIDLAVEAACVDGRATFTVRNRGTKTPDMMVLAAFPAKNKRAPIATRTLTLKNGQSPSLRLGRHQSNEAYALVVVAHGFTQPFEVEKEFRCS